MNQNYGGAPNIPGSAKVSAAALAEAQSLVENFEKANENRFTVEGIVSEGSFGVTIKMKVKEAPTEMLQALSLLGPKSPKYFVVKRSLREDAQQSIKNEIEFLQVRRQMRRTKPGWVSRLLMVGCSDYKERPIYRSHSESVTRPMGISWDT